MGNFTLPFKPVDKRARVLFSSGFEREEELDPRGVQLKKPLRFGVRDDENTIVAGGAIAPLRGRAYDFFPHSSDTAEVARGVKDGRGGMVDGYASGVRVHRTCRNVHIIIGTEGGVGMVLIVNEPLQFIWE